MPRKREGYTQLPVEMPDEMLAAVRAAAEAAGVKVTPYVLSILAAEVGVEYTPPRLGRPPAEPEPEPEPPKPRKGKGRGRKPAPPAPTGRRGRAGG